MVHLYFRLILIRDYILLSDTFIMTLYTNLRKTQVRIYPRAFFCTLMYRGDQMGVKEAVVARFREIMSQRNMKPNELAYRAGVTPSTVYSMLDGRRREVTINLVKKLCDGLDMTLGEFFNAPVFDELEQEIK